MITFPLYVRSADGQFHVRPLFSEWPNARGERLERALQRLTRDLREMLHFMGAELRHDRLASFSFNPEVDYHRLDIQIELRRRVARSRFLFVVFEALGRRVAFTPSLPDLWFEVNKGQNLHGRANEVLSEHFRTREKEDGTDFVKPEQLALSGNAWIHPLELEINPNPKLPSEDDSMHMFLGSREKLDGERELFRIGRCLDHLYPDDLERVLLRDREINDLSSILNSVDQRPALLVGPAQVGKTALIHEYVFRTVQARQEKQKLKQLTFLVSPQRLISGMSYVGQWENRLLAILKVAAKKGHLLFFDDLLGLYHAGITCQSDLSVAQVLKPFVERHDVRLIAEATPEILRVLRERDRGFADLFHIIPVREPNEAETLQILIATQRKLEGEHQCQFAIDCLPAAIDLQRRYARHAAFPGKAATFLRRLAVKRQKTEIPRREILNEFHLQSGLSLSFLDSHRKLEREQIIEAMQRRVIGQRAAVEVAADVISIAKARLNDPERPLGTLLFLGPTGVGKTECAKAIAHYLFGDADKLIRFDMNEYGEPGSASRLVGTFWHPEGLLTTAIRRQPFAVVLFDEIEKGHPEVFDLLLQVLGEGRLTDAHGRLADFTNTIIVLTSNLGVRHSSVGLGFRQDDQAERVAFHQAAERFFRPEFFNRLDRIVPFERLSLQDIGAIATGLIEQLLKREGLARRKCLLEIEPGALSQIVNQGFDPRFGARVLKRMIERNLTQAVAAELTRGLPDSFTHVHVYPAAQQIKVHVEELTQVPANEPRPDLTDEQATLARAKQFLNRMTKKSEHLRPNSSTDGASSDDYGYFTIQAALDKLRRWIRHLEDRLEDQLGAGRRFSPRPEQFRGERPKMEVREQVPHSNVLHELAAAQDIHQFLKELTATASKPLKHGRSKDDEILGSVSDLVNYAAYIQVLVECVQTAAPDQVLIHLRTPNLKLEDWISYLSKSVLPELFDSSLGLEVEPLKDERGHRQEATLVAKGLAAWPVAKLEEGTHLCCPNHGGIAPIQVMVWPVPEGGNPRSVLEMHEAQRQEWRSQMLLGESTIQEDPYHFLPVVCLHQEGSKRLDFRSGIVFTNTSKEWLARSFTDASEWLESPRACVPSNPRFNQERCLDSF